MFQKDPNENITIEDYHSHNTERLNKVGMKKLLLKLELITNDIKS